MCVPVKTRPLKEKQIACFWSKVEKTENGCWTWRASKSNQGYGYVRVNGKTYKAHRIAYEIAYGRPPDDLLVCHYCDNPSCVRPDHLWIGTNRDNTLDRHRKGRTFMPRYTGGYKFPPERIRGGELSPRAKLKNRQVDEMRARFADGNTTIETLANEYGVSKYTVRDIIKGKTRISHLKQL